MQVRCAPASVYAAPIRHCCRPSFLFSVSAGAYLRSLAGDERGDSLGERRALVVRDGQLLLRQLARAIAIGDSGGAPS